MVERRTPTANPRIELEESLKIDRDDLDSCLVDQPGLFFHVAEQVTEAKAKADGLKLDLEETMATEDGRFRALCATNGEKVTEAGIQNYLKTLPAIQTLQRKVLDARTAADHWAALKEAYQQRSYMLKELVALHLSQFYNLGVERGTTNSRHQLGDANRERAEVARRERRERG